MSRKEKADAPKDRSGMTRLVRDLLRPYRGWLTIIFLAMVVETAMSLAGPWPLKIVLDSVIGHHPMPHWVAHLIGPGLADHKMGLAGVAAGLIVLIAVIGSAASYVDNYYTESVGQYVANDLRMRVYHHLDRLSLGYYDKQQTGNLLSTITTDITTIQNFASGATLGILVDILTIVGMLGLMFWLNFDFTLIAVAVTPFLLLFVSRFKKAVKKATHEVRHRQSDIVAVVQEGLESMRVVKAYGREQLEEEHLKDASQAAVDAALKARRIKSLLTPVVDIVVSLCTGFVLYRGALLILAERMTIGALTVFLSYLNKFFKPVQDLAKMTNSIAQAAVAVERVQTILAADEMIPEKPDAHEPKDVKGEITFDKVAFAYKPDSPVLKEITFKIEPGQLVGFVGATGGGKSTVASLIPRFYDASQGRVLIDGMDVKDLKLKPLRDKIGLVLQDTVLFAGTIADNIGYGRPGATREEIVAAAKLANADEFIAKMPKGYDSEVGERGMTLSGGQRQRIGIARAIIRNSPILILDEPTAALDTESEKLVMEGLERLMKGRTAIAIAHRLSTIKDADKIVVFKDGFVHEQGTHTELLQKNGLYAELYRIQFPSEAPAAPGTARA
ncbi:MAG TPA: ABC transporter ATP-binding protein [Thermoanaerobaculia bacterium]|nr:ABC transporter ATP-binding protein [Thermoanaerobaculia bacterium]